MLKNIIENNLGCILINYKKQQKIIFFIISDSIKKNPYNSIIGYKNIINIILKCIFYEYIKKKDKISNITFFNKAEEQNLISNIKKTFIYIKILFKNKKKNKSLNIILFFNIFVNKKTDKKNENFYLENILKYKYNINETIINTIYSVKNIFNKKKIIIKNTLYLQIILSIKINNITDLFYKFKTTGTKDPFKIRRNIIYIIKILIKNKINIDLIPVFIKQSILYNHNINIYFLKNSYKINSFIKKRVKQFYKNRYKTEIKFKKCADLKIYNNIKNHTLINKKIKKKTLYQYTKDKKKK